MTSDKDLVPDSILEIIRSAELTDKAREHGFTNVAEVVASLLPPQAQAALWRRLNQMPSGRGTK